MFFKKRESLREFSSSRSKSPSSHQKILNIQYTVSPPSSLLFFISQTFLYLLPNLGRMSLCSFGHFFTVGYFTFFCILNFLYAKQNILASSIHINRWKFSINAQRSSTIPQIKSFMIKRLWYLHYKLTFILQLQV